MWDDDPDAIAFGRIWPLWYGDSETRDLKAAVARLRPLADRGFAPAQFALAVALSDGEGVRRDHAAAFRLAQAAAEQAYPSAELMVGNYFVIAEPPPEACRPDPEEGLRWHLLAAARGNSAAQFNLATAYWTGRGTDTDPIEAFVWASLSVHCSPIRNRMAETLREQARAELGRNELESAGERVAKLSSELPHPWSEHMLYWKHLAKQAGVIDES